MSRFSDDPVNHVVTFRVNREEKKALESLARKAGCSVSSYMRLRLQNIKDREHSKT
jgi:hypothetical protein